MPSRPPRAEQLAASRRLQQQQLARAAASVADEAWAGIDPHDIARSWATLLGRPAAAVTGAQHMAAEGAGTYVGEALAAQGLSTEAAGFVAPSSLAGIAADGRPLESLLYQPAIQSLQAIGAGAPVERALTVGRLSLDMIVRTQVADAGRVATGIAVTASPYIGYIRHISPGACSRCTVLAGRIFRWNTGFLRHPNCHCVHVPTVAAKAGSIGRSPRGYFDSLSAAEQDRIFTRAGAQAIRDGANMGRIVNARSGMQVAGRSGTRARTPRRLTPEEIYRRAQNDRQAALRLLRQNGYLVDQPTRINVPAVARPAVPTFDARFRAAASNESALQATPAGLPRQSGAPTLTRPQRAALRDYESSFYYAINGQLRRGEVGALVGRRVDRIDQVMALSRTSGEIAAWRGITDAERLFGDRLGGNLTGFTWVERAYGSTTVDRRIAETFTYPGVDQAPKVLMRILVPRGTGAARISGMGSGHGGGQQAEVLLQRGLRMRVVADRGMSPAGYRMIDVEVIVP